MPKIISTTDLTLAPNIGALGSTQNLFIDFTTFKIHLAEHGALDSEGVNINTVYSRLKQLWISEPGFSAYDFPMETITTTQFEMINGWDWADDTTRLLIKDGGWTYKITTTTKNDTISSVYFNLTTLGNFDSPLDQAYYIHTADGTPVNFNLSGQVNQAIQIFGDAAHGNFDYRLSTNSNFVVYLRVQGKTYAAYNLNVAQAIEEFEPTKYTLPLENRADLDITESDANIAINAPYTGMSITWGAVQRTIGAGTYNFGVVINGNNGTLQEIYEFVQWSLRQSTDIDAGAGTQIGQIADELLAFVGPTLVTKLTSNGGVYVDNFREVDTNDIKFVDDLGEERSFPFIAAGTINFSPTLVTAGVNGKYWMYFLNANGNEFNSPNAIIVDDADGIDITGTIPGASTSFSFDYDGNVQGGRTAGTNAQVVLVALGTVGSQYVKAEGTISRSTLNVFTLTGAQERNYRA